MKPFLLVLCALLACLCCVPTCEANHARGLRGVRRPVQRSVTVVRSVSRGSCASGPCR